MKDRVTILGLTFLLGTVALIGRLYFWQIVRGESLAIDAKAQQVNREIVQGERGKIYASDGSVLVGNQKMWRPFAYMPDMTTNISELIAKVSPILVQNQEDTSQLAVASESARLTALFSDKTLSWIPLKSKITREQKDQITALNINGLGFDEVNARMYPEGSSSAQLVGFVGKDSNGNDLGYFGLEGYYNLLLSGKSGVKELTTNAAGVPLAGETDGRDGTLTGVNLDTTISKPIQLMVESELRQGLEKYESESGSVVIMDVKDGGILAMASLPSFDPEKYYQGSDSLFRNPVISDSFEPGSIMKPIVMAAALNENLITPDTICDICNGPYHVDQYLIRTWNNQYRPNSTMRDVIIHSDNVGMVFVGKKLGKDRLINYFEKFGFGSLTNIDLQGEFAAPLRKKSEWGEVEQDTASFGQGIAVTGIQMLKAISAIANKGVLLNPHIVRELTLGNTKTGKGIGTGQRVISEKAAADMTSIMIDAVRKGEAQWAAPKDYTLAGKTGTAQVAVSGSYDDTKTNASFIGFGPAEDPRFVMLVTLNEPKSSPWAAETAAPLWFKIAEKTLRYMGVAPNK